MSESATTERDREHLPAVVTEETAPAAEPAAPTTTTIPDDPDDRAVFEAKAELQRAEAGTDGGQQQQQQQQQQTPPAPAATTTTPTPTPAPQARQQPAVVPAGVLAEERRKSRALADEVLYLKGALAARTQQPSATTQPGGGQQQPSTQELLQAEGARLIAAAKQFDQGELSMEQYKLIELQSQDRIAALRAQHLLAHVQSTQQPAGNAVGIADAHVLEQHLEKMTQEHPWSALLNDSEIDWLSHVARDEFRGLGKPVTPGNHVDTLRLRQRVAELSDTFGPTWYPNHRIAPPQQPTAQPSQQGVTQPQAAGNSRVQQTARLAAVAANQPPSLSTAGHADAGDAAMTTAMVEGMTEDEIIERLPRGRLRDRYLLGA
jgi:hypothetical protein